MISGDQLCFEMTTMFLSEDLLLCTIRITRFVREDPLTVRVPGLQIHLGIFDLVADRAVSNLEVLDRLYAIVPIGDTMTNAIAGLESDTIASVHDELFLA
jgi:hypothetical protein